MSNFKVGNIVEVINIDLASYGKRGRVDQMKRDLLLVAFDKYSTWISIDNVAPLETNSITSSKRYMAYLHLHDEDFNPPEEEVLSLYGINEWGLGEPDGMMYGTIDEIKEWALNFDELYAYSNAFLIIDSKYYPIEMNPQIKGL